MAANHNDTVHLIDRQIATVEQELNALDGMSVELRSRHHWLEGMLVGLQEARTLLAQADEVQPAAKDKR